MKNVFYAVLILLAAQNVWANGYEPYQWEKDRKRQPLTTKEESYAEYILKHHVQYEFFLEKDDFIMYSTLHRIVRVNNSEAIERHNKIYLSMDNTLELVDLKARSINKDGKVVYFDKNNLKEIKDEETGNAYRIFAIEGVELGSEIEYYFTRKMSATIFDRVFVQFEMPIKNSSFYLTCPKHLKFDFKAYNGYSSINSETKEDRNIYKASLADIPGLKKEDFSSFDSNRQRIEFKLAYNSGKSNARLYTWDDAAKYFYKRLTTLNKEEEKAIDKFVKALNDNVSQTTEDRIKHIENSIKTAIKVNKESHVESLRNLQSITKNKLASEEGIMKLFISVLDKVKIQCHPVVTCSREKVKFDGSFDSWSTLDDYILYLPETKGFLAPSIFELRYPLVPAELTAQKGLFIEPYIMGEVKSALATVKEIPALDYTYNVDNLDIEVIFNDDLVSNNVKMKREFSGYNASFVAPYYSMIGEVDRAKLVEELIKQTAPDPSIKKWKASTDNTGREVKFILDVDFNTSHFIEKAGPRILFKVGELIGPQVEMYRDDQRMTHIENDFNRGYDRVIKVQLPEGYQVKNLQDLNLNVLYKDKDNVPFLFVSEFSKKEVNYIEIKIKEYYKEIFAPIDRYEDFRKVINAAADFNKITLVLEKVK